MRMHEPVRWTVARGCACIISAARRRERRYNPAVPAAHDAPSLPFTVLLGFPIALTAPGMDMLLPALPALGAAFTGSAVPMACAIAAFGIADAGAERGLLRRRAGTG
jgi:hypothetical protein